MRILEGFAKKLFSFRKIVWLFLCGMLLLSGKAGAQQPDAGLKVKYGPPPRPSDRLTPAPDRPYKIEPVVKYGVQRPRPAPPSGQKGAAAGSRERRGTPPQGRQRKNLPRNDGAVLGPKIS